jgi:hypothetical protein
MPGAAALYVLQAASMICDAKAVLSWRTREYT